MKALVVFADAAPWWLRPLRRGFRHCFVALLGPGGWVVVDPLSHWTQILQFPAGADLAGWYRGRGLAVVEVETVAPPARLAPLRPYSCVEEVKRILGLQAGWVLTPWQLFKFLCHKGKKSLTTPPG